MKAYTVAKRHVTVSAGESVRIIRVLQELSQNDLSKASGICRSTISAIENSRANVGAERAKKLAKVLCCHPAVILGPD